MKELKGIASSPGIAIGRAFLYADEEQSIPNYSIERSDVETEWTRFIAALAKAEAEMTELRERTKSEVGSEQSAIFDSHIMMLNDPDLMDQIEISLKTTLKNIEFIIWQQEQKLVKKLAESQNQYMRERVVDIHDVSRRIINNLLLRERVSIADLKSESILISHNLMPSDAVTIDKKSILAIALDSGGRTSHTAILARAFQIPAVLGLGDISRIVKPGNLIIVDGNSGTVIIDPDPETEHRYRVLKAEAEKLEATLLSASSAEAKTKDGFSVTLKANIEIPDEVEAALSRGATGIGLYRSEFLFLTPGCFASEEEQYIAYSTVLERMGDRPVTIRTLDLGGDKMIPELETQAEKNPLLGWRAIRFCLTRKDIFSAQLRAMLRASVKGNLKIMFPMISGPEEIDYALEILERVKDELRREGIPFSSDIEIGIMIEIPSAALMADILAKKVKFFSIGTNDLIQYTIAVDRGNEKTAYLYQPFHPGVLRLVKSVLDAAKTAGIPCSMCGEMAGDPRATAVLLGLGLEEFSMSSQAIPTVKDIVRSIDKAEAKTLADTVMGMGSHREIDALITKWMAERFPGRS